LPELEKIRQELEPKGVGFLALSLHRNPAVVERAAAKMGVTMPVAVAQGEMMGPFAVKVVPATLFVDAEGKVVAAVSGARSYSFLKERADALLK
jgi:hypothetical protein